MSDTPETDEAVKASNGQWSFVLKEACQRLERERNKAVEDATNYYAKIGELERERDGLLKKLKSSERECVKQRKDIEMLELALKAVREERDEARNDLEFRRELYRVQENYLEQAREERDEAREALADYKASTVHSCNEECKRPMCVLRRERDEAREKYHQICSQTLIEINKAHEERDEALKALSGRTVSCAACNHAAIERDEAREKYATEATEHMLAVNKLCNERDNWEQTAADYLEGMHYYRGLVQEIGETIGEAACLQDDGGKVDSVLCAKVPELVEELKRERDELKKIVEQRILVGAEIHDKANSLLKQSNRTEAECEALRKQLTAATSALRQIHLEVGEWIRSTIIIEE